MTRPKYLYEIEEHKFVAHGDDGRCLTLQQADLIRGDRGNDSRIYVDRENAAALLDALAKWLAETAEQTVTP